MKAKHNLFKQLTGLVIAIVLMVHLIPITGQAQEIRQATNTTVISSEDGSQNISISDSTQRIPNIWSIEVGVSGQDDKIVISAHNVGVDTIDKRFCKEKVTDTSGRVQFNKTISFKGIVPFMSQTYRMTIKNWSKIEITEIQAWDGSDYDTHADHTVLRNK